MNNKEYKDILPHNLNSRLSAYDISTKCDCAQDSRLQAIDWFSLVYRLV